jgi:hypothetical protein
MSKITAKRLFAAVLWCLAPALAAAWTPYGAGAPGPESGYAPAGAGTPGGGLPGGGQEPTPEGYPSYPGYPPFGPRPGMGGGLPGASGFGMQPSGFQISRQASPDAYTIDIRLHGLKPQQVQIQTRGQWIRISQIGSRQQVQEDTFDQGRGFMRSYSYSSGTASRQFSVPPDGDLGAMKREESGETIHITIPRRKR